MSHLYFFHGEDLMITIVTDSMSDLTPSEAESLGVVLIPLTVRFGTHEYREGFDISREEFLRFGWTNNMQPILKRLPKRKMQSR